MNVIRRGVILKRGTKKQEREVIITRDFTDRSIYDDWKASGVERAFLDFFLRRTVTLTPCWEADTVKQFWNRVTLATAPEKVYVRLDDREFESNSSRPYADSLSVEQLYHHLSQSRFKAPNLPDAHRRLVSIRNLDANSILTLAETALFHQVDPLVDAFWKHLTSETSFRVHEPLNGFVTPRLEFHMPYLTLRRCTGDHGPVRKEWADITFLDRGATGKNGTDRQLIHEAHISIVLCIWDYRIWTGYRFSRPCPFDAADLVDDEDDDDIDADEDDEDVPKEDIFAPDSGDHDMNDDPIWDPRMYFLHLMAIWVDFVLKEYTYLIRTLEELVTESEKIDHRDNVQPVFEHTTQTMQILRRVRNHTFKATKAWRLFSAASDGDIRLFKDLKERKAKVALSVIKESFGKLAILDQNLVTLNTRCKESFEALGLLLSVQSNMLSRETYTETLEATKLNRKTTGIAKKSQKAAVETQYISQINIEVFLFTTPFILALQYFGSERDIFSFDRNTKNFIYCVLVLMIALRLFIWVLNPLAHVKSYVATKTTRILNKGATSKHIKDDDEIELDENIVSVAEV